MSIWINDLKLAKWSERCLASGSIRYHYDKVTMSLPADDIERIEGNRPERDLTPEEKYKSGFMGWLNLAIDIVSGNNEEEIDDGGSYIESKPKLIMRDGNQYLITDPESFDKITTALADSRVQEVKVKF